MVQKNLNSMIDEITSYLGLHMQHIETELNLGVDPHQFEIFCELRKAFNIAFIVMHSLKVRCPANDEEWRNSVYPLLLSCYNLKQQTENDILEAGLGKMLAMIGFIASSLRMNDFAMFIFKVLRMYRPESEYPWIGIAVIQLDMGKFKKAVSTIRDKALKINPHNDLARAILALAYTFLKRDAESKILAEDIAKASEVAAAVDLAKAIAAL